MKGELTGVLHRFLTDYGSWVAISLLVLFLGSLIFLERASSGKNRDPPHVRQGHRGPKIYPFLGCQLESLRNLHRLYDWSTSYLRKDPTNTIRLKRALTSSWIVSTANPRNVEHILKTNFANYPKGETMLGALKPLLGEGIFNSDGDIWRSQRKIASHEFSTKTVRDFIIELVHGETYNRLLPLLSKVHSEGSVIDIQDLLLRFGFDNICRLGFGVDMGCLDISLPEIEFAYAFDEATRLTFQRFFMPTFVYLFLDSLAFFGIGHSCRLRNTVKVVDRFAQSIIEKRRKELESRKNHAESRVLKQEELASKFSRGNSDLLSRFIQYDEETQGRAQGKDGTAAMSDKYLRDIILNFILAGRDTAAVALTWFFWLLPKHPEVEKKMVDEITSIRWARKDSLQENESGKVEGFTYDELREMHYVQAAITESMRLYPPVPGDAKGVFADDYLPDGTFVRKGDRVSFNIWAMGRMESVWGKDCLEFKPERFLQDGKFAQENSFKYPIFLAGPRICLGKEMAYTQMKYLVAAILSSPYRFQLLPKPSPKFELSITLKMKDGLLSTNKVLQRSGNSLHPYDCTSLVT
ncbi:hypothetical protein R1flu_021049 [Riccia fluitans]|uniref:Cytochrome P450 n=1 Tax=Riccia fluitans TaxID=41844 RepID=A0ABD1ZN92_9MARC